MEAGGSELGIKEFEIPAGFISVQRTQYDWEYYTEPQKHACQSMHERVVRKFSFIYNLYIQLVVMPDIQVHVLYKYSSNGEKDSFGQQIVYVFLP